MTTQKARYATANNTNVGDFIEFLKIPYYKDDMRMYWIKREVSSIELTKTGKRVQVKFTDGYSVSNIAPNSPFEELTDKFLAEQEKQRGWK